MQPLTWLFLGMPPIVGLMLPRLKALVGRELACICALVNVSWQPAPKGGKAGDPLGARREVVHMEAGRVFQTIMESEELDAGIRKLMAVHKELVEACAGAGNGVAGPGPGWAVSWGDGRCARHGTSSPTAEARVPVALGPSRWLTAPLTSW